MKQDITVALQVSDLDHKRIDGTRVYLRELLKRFGKIDTETRFSLYHRRIFNPHLAPPSLANYFVKVLFFPCAWMQTRFVWEIFRTMPEKLFLPIQASPFFVSKKTEVTVTIHDLAFRRYPKTFPKMYLFKLNLLLYIALHRANKLIVVSESTKNDIREFFPDIPEERIRVIHHGFDSQFFGVRISPTELSEKLASFHIQEKSYMLYVGALQPRKNLVRLIEAFDEAKKQFPEMKLVFAGERAWLSEVIFETRERSPYKEDILMLGAVSFEDLRVLYQGARFFVFPSLYEGFGLPILEAFASGIPVLTANNSSLIEVGGDAVIFCDASDTESMTDKIVLLWNDEKVRQECISRGEKQLQKFSWDKCARETLEYILS